MLEHVLIGQYVPGRSVVHRLDPRAKLASLFLFMVFLFVSRELVVLGAAAVLTAAALLSAGISLRFFWKGTRLVLIIVALTFFLHLFLTQEGRVLLEIGPLAVYSGGLLEGFVVGFRLLLLIVLATLLTLTTTPVDLTDGIESLLRPLSYVRVPTHEFALMMSIALRFIPTLLTETQTIMKAQMARGAAFSRGSVWNRLKAFLPVLIPLFSQSFKRAEDLATAMEARGYNGGAGRTKYRELSWKLSDTLIFCMFLAFAGLSLWTRIG
ncbi:energy-coupling factor transporter transmembrane component T family protein [Alkalicoccus urumqiensis]|uniref:Transporter n=1 Tax=Alkalicoccus urumqiensis TaxID=1548213 RepID=A0A2P6ME75_ALKUR|nr:energy-coupling factor transporter transmembrane protein EcfT [Alkalicoccus urumqiensis]PRO64577.1 transporter [Alkalicoccus urumqiensis]